MAWKKLENVVKYKKTICAISELQLSRALCERLLQYDVNKIVKFEAVN